MRQLLKLHPHSRCFAEKQIEVGFTRPRAYSLELSYIVTGNIGELCIPPVTASARSDQLWRHTCFEAFLRASSTEYYEFNFAPTTQWAAYRFSGYRSGKRVAEISAPAIEVRSGPDRYTLQASLQLDSLFDLPSQAPWRLGLSALIEDTSGRMSYWALAHPSGKPDFHHSDCFAYEFSPVRP
jgi:hypothetical protein